MVCVISSRIILDVPMHIYTWAPSLPPNLAYSKGRAPEGEAETACRVQRGECPRKTPQRDSAGLGAGTLWTSVPGTALSRFPGELMDCPHIPPEVAHLRGLIHCSPLLGGFLIRRWAMC